MSRAARTHFPLYLLLFAAFATVALFAFRTVDAAGDSARGALVFETCLGCHGIENYKNVYPTYAVPRLAGQSAQYVVDALNAYASGQRAHPTMHAQAATLTDEDKQDIGAYLESLGGEIGGDSGEPPTQAATCLACHGPDGVGTAPNFPTLAGQHEDYLVHALSQYKSQARQNAIMAGFAAQLSAEDMEALAAWYAAKPGLETVE